MVPVNKHSYWFSYPADKRGAVLVFKSYSSNMTKISYCAEPSPDAVTEYIIKASGNGDTPTGHINGNAEASSKVNVATKSQTLMLMRESLYRLCELSMNTELSANTVKEMFNKTLDTVQEMFRAETAKHEAETKKRESRNQLFNTYLNTVPKEQVNPEGFNKFLDRMEK